MRVREALCNTAGAILRASTEACLLASIRTFVHVQDPLFQRVEEPHREAWGR